MSTKTYAGFRVVRNFGSQYSLSGKDGYVLCPLDDGVEWRYRSRLGYPWANSGPWMTVERTIDVDNPSTDGCYDLSIGTASGVALEVWVAMGPSYINARWTWMDSGGTRYMRLQYLQHDYMSGKRASNYYANVTRSEMSGYTRYVPEKQLPFTARELYLAYENRDWSKALRVALMSYSLFKEMPVDRIETPEGTVTTAVRHFDRYVALDTTPPESVYLATLEDASMYLLTGILPGPWAMGLETAYIEACKSMPQAATNAAANVLECASTLARIFKGDVSGVVPKTARDAWLSYRYVYTTTKLDIREVKSTFDRLDDVLNYDSIPVYGTYTRGNVEYRVGFDISTAQILPRDVSATLRKFGLELNALNIWDMIPYSFVADWFLPISDIIEYFQDLSACRYEPTDRWFSIVTTIGGYRIYVRLPGRKLSTMPYLQLSSAGTKTICLRIADAVALFAP